MCTSADAVAAPRHGVARDGLGQLPDPVYDNPPNLVERLASEMKAYMIKPEVEPFDLSMIFQAAATAAAGKIVGPLHAQLVMAIKNAMPVDREVFEF